MTTSESFRREVADKVDSILNASDPRASVAFSSCLSAEERKYVHHIAEQFGLRHDSTGKGDARFITVCRDPAKLHRRNLGGAAATALQLTTAASEALEHPLLVHAAQGDHLEALARVCPSVAIGPAEVESLLGGHNAGGKRRGGGQEAKNTAGEAVQAGGRGPPETALLGLRKKLPVWASREAIVAATCGSGSPAQQVTIIVGETGCGKSTQIPQFILEEYPGADVIVTQPRRISALALANRVAQERDEEVGQTVGFSVHLESQQSAATKVLYCTNGVFRRRLLSDPSLTGVTHIVLDELHERDKVADFLLIAIKELLQTRPDLHIVLMSATMQYETFRNYFPGCAEVHVPGRTYPVEEIFLEDVAPLLHQRRCIKELGPGFAAGGLGYGNWSDKGKEKSFKYQVLVGHAGDRDGVCGYGYNARKELTGERFEEGLFLHDVLQQLKGVTFDIPIIEALLVSLLDDSQGSGWQIPKYQDRSGGVLVFLPGWDDIDKLKRRLRKHPLLGDQRRFWILPLHGQIRLEQQREVFKVPPKSVSKIILSTNIAETALTIDDVTVVIDCGRAKETSFDACLNVPTLNTSWVSKASLVQRAGRAGRTSAGICFHMFSKRRAALLDPHRPPELLRSALDDVCLHAKLLLTMRGQPEVGAQAFLQSAPDPPDERNVATAEKMLREIGALTADEEAPGRLTALGTHLSALPLGAQYAKIMVWANLLGVGEEALAVVSALQYRDPFVGIGDANEAISLAEANKSVRLAKRRFCSPYLSDHLALLAASEGFEEARAAGGHTAASTFCDGNCLSFRQMDSLRRTRDKLRGELRGSGLWRDKATNGSGSQAVAVDKQSSAALLAAAVCAGLFPNVAHGSLGVGKLKAGSGKLEAKPHPSSVLSFSARGEDIKDYLGAKNAKGAEKSWLCFNELSQVEDNYALSGLSPVTPVVLLLLCGEGDLVMRETGEDGASSSAAAADENGQNGQSSGFAAFWKAAVPGKKGPAEINEDAGDKEGPDEVILSIDELGDWLSVTVSRAVAKRLQVLRAMLRLLFRTFCADSTRWQQLSAEGQVGSVVLQLVRTIVTSCTAEQAAKAEQPLPEAPASWERQWQAQRSYYPQERGGARSSSGKGKGKGKAAVTWCEGCRSQVPQAGGGVDPTDGIWYCANCWYAYGAVQHGAQARRR
eukprot:TRINITY_DN8312_c1_g1_i1.p1 TRINITY_DN8312_c1_g1~~TRINITY_DN8312_c1_g1_i1.p1  ORF type:complete len:1171 (+),score=262.54 TRINITY_DN8312_c1_g1_i1:100-3612(+)